MVRTLAALSLAQLLSGAPENDLPQTLAHVRNVLVESSGCRSAAEMSGLLARLVKKKVIAVRRMSCPKSSSEIVLYFTPPQSDKQQADVAVEKSAAPLIGFRTASTLSDTPRTPAPSKSAATHNKTSAFQTAKVVRSASAASLPTSAPAAEPVALVPDTKDSVEFGGFRTAKSISTSTAIESIQKEEQARESKNSVATVAQTPTRAPLKRKVGWNTPFKSPLAAGAPPRSAPGLIRPSKMLKTPSSVRPINAASTPAVSTTPAPRQLHGTHTTPIRPPAKNGAGHSMLHSAPQARGGLLSASKKPFMSPLARVDPAVREKKELDRAIEDLVGLKRKYTLYQTYMENNEIPKVDRLIAKWKTVCQDALRHLRDEVGEIMIPKPTAASSYYDDDKPQKSGVGIHPREASSWGNQGSDEDDKDDAADNLAMGYGFDAMTDNKKPRKLLLIEMANLCQFDVHMIGKYDLVDDDFS